MTTESRTVFVNGKRLQVTLRVNPGSYRDRPSKTVVYVNCPQPEELDQTAGHPAYTSRGDDPVADAGWKAYNKLEVANMRAVAEAAMVGTLGFSRNAGCSCGCSPGFVLKDRRLGPNASVFVTAKAF